MTHAPVLPYIQERVDFPMETSIQGTIEKERGPEMVDVITLMATCT
jgi:hypothetical protein